MTDTNHQPAEEPEQWWWCHWVDGEGFTVKLAYSGLDRLDVRWRDGHLVYSAWDIRSATEPTLTEFRDAVHAATGVTIPEPEQPTWWHWDGEWDEAEAEMAYASVYTYPGSDERVNVYGTESTRDAKRDALLEAAKAAGKQGGEEQ